MPLFGPPDIHQLEAKRDTQGLIKALSFKDAAIRMAAAEALGPLKDPTAVEPLVGLLKDDNAGVRIAAVAALAARGGHRVVEPLVATLEDTNFDVRATAATAVYRRLMTDADAETRRNTSAALGRLRISDAVEPLTKATMDSDETVRVASIKALQALRDCDAIIPLITVLAREQVRQKSTGRSSLPVERAASQALDTLCDESGIEALQTAMRHEDTDVREIAVRRLARIASPVVTESLVAVLADKDPGVRRAAARGLAELQWKPTANEAGVFYWAALREWLRCAECGDVAIPFLVASVHDVDALERADIISALGTLNWQPDEADATAAQYWAARGEWGKCIATGEPAVEALDGALRTAPRWRDRVGAAAALAEIGQPRIAPFARLDLVQRALTILDSSSGEDRRSLLETLLADAGELNRETESVEWCTCGYPAALVKSDGQRDPIANLLGLDESSGKGKAYFCPSCDTRRTTVAG
jgi:HEAT repeat protein